MNNKWLELPVYTILLATNIAQYISDPKGDVMSLCVDKTAYFSVAVAMCCFRVQQCCSVWNNQFNWRTNSSTDRELYAFESDFYRFSAYFLWNIFIYRIEPLAHSFIQTRPDFTNQQYTIMGNKIYMVTDMATDFFIIIFL